MPQPDPDDTTKQNDADEETYWVAGTAGWRRFAIVGLFVLALLASVQVAKPFLLPVVLAQLFTFVLRPVHRFLVRWYVPGVLAAFLILLALLGASAFGAIKLAGPAAAWMTKLPSRDMVEDKLSGLMEGVEQVSEAAEKMDEMAEVPDDQPKVVLDTGKVSDAVFGYGQVFSITVVVSFILLFFMLAYGDSFYRKLAQNEETAQLVDEIATNVSRYLFTITVINICLGIAIGTAMWLLEMPSPVLWGVMATCLNFVPFLGALVGVCIVGLVALLTFEQMSRILVVPLAYFALTSLEGNFITPVVLGRRFTVNPIIIFVWLLFWGWIWGIPGALIAVPLLMAFRIFCDHVRPLQRVGELMSM